MPHGIKHLGISSVSFKAVPYKTQQRRNGRKAGIVLPLCLGCQSGEQAWTLQILVSTFKIHLLTIQVIFLFPSAFQVIPSCTAR